MFAGRLVEACLERGRGERRGREEEEAFDITFHV